MFGISGEHLIILAIILIIFGPRRLPELGNTMGKAIRNFKDAIAGVEEASFRKLDETQSNQNAKPSGTTESKQASKDGQDTNSKPS
jgi:sec-independent protein translocase protein TatA